MSYVWKIFLPALCLLLSSCLSWFGERPTLKLKEVHVERLSLSDLHLLFGIEVTNPNRFDLTLGSLEYTVFLNDREVGQGRLKKEVALPHSSATLVQVPLRADLQKIGGLWTALLAGPDLKYRIEGTALIQTGLGSSKVPFRKSDSIRLK